MQPAGSTVPGTSDRECLESWARHHDADSLQTLVERYLGFVHSSALRRTGDAAQAAEVTRAVFLVLARRARRLRKNTVLAGWLFHVTTVGSRRDGDIAMAIFASYVIGQFMPSSIEHHSAAAAPKGLAQVGAISNQRLLFQLLAVALGY